jgi:serine/threonine protein phosphatase PrpC
MTQILFKSSLLTNKEIWQSDIETNLSGSTMVSILIKKNKVFYYKIILKLYCANVGDSRAIMCSF